MSSFSDRWRVPDAPGLMADWRRDLALMEHDCRCPDGYHLLWAGLRLAGHNVGLYWEAEQLREVLGKLLACARNVFIAGSADHLVLALLSDIAGDSRDRHFHLVDRCPAPLKLAEAYAERRRLKLSTLVADLDAGLPPGCSPDLIFMHYTLDFMSAGMRARVLARMAEILSPEGRIVVSHRKSLQTKPPKPVSEWVDGIHDRLPQDARSDSKLNDILEKYLPRYGASRANRVLDVDNNDNFLAQATRAGLKLLSSQSTHRNRMLQDSRDRNRSQEHSTLFVLGRTR